MKRRKLFQRVLFALLLLIGLIYGQHPGDDSVIPKESVLPFEKSEGIFRADMEPAADAAAGDQASGLTVHYLDVEKCNCVLVESGDGHFMLIDAGSNDDAHTQKTVEYLRQLGVETLDYLLITHPHSDHIRSVPEIVNRFSVNEVIMGDFEREEVGTRIFSYVLDAMEAKDLLITRPSEGEVYFLGNASFTILLNDDSALTAAEKLNDCSIGLILTDGIHRFLFYGDGEEKAEESLLAGSYDLSCDVLMAAHHGSSSSTSEDLLFAVKPQIAVIPCGIDGDGEAYAPSDKVLRRLNDQGVAVYRSDTNGNIVIESSLEGLNVKTEK